MSFTHLIKQYGKIHKLGNKIIKHKKYINKVPKSKIELEFQKHDDGSLVTRGTSWIELMILATYRGHYKPIAKLRHTDRQVTAAKQINHFKKTAKCVLRGMACTDEQNTMFSPKEKTYNTFIGLAIEGNIPSIKGAIWTSEEEKSEYYKTIAEEELEKELKDKDIPYIQDRLDKMQVKLDKLIKEIFKEMDAR